MEKYLKTTEDLSMTYKIIFFEVTNLNLSGAVLILVECPHVYPWSSGFYSIDYKEISFKFKLTTIAKYV